MTTETDDRRRQTSGRCDLCHRPQVLRFETFDGQWVGLCCIFQGIRFHSLLPDDAIEDVARRTYRRDRAIHEVWHQSGWREDCTFCQAPKP
jgi:hypothetical protein